MLPGNSSSGSLQVSPDVDSVPLQLIGSYPGPGGFVPQRELNQRETIWVSENQTIDWFTSSSVQSGFTLYLTGFTLGPWMGDVPVVCRSCVNDRSW